MMLYLPPGLSPYYYLHTSTQNAIFKASIQGKVLISAHELILSYHVDAARPRYIIAKEMCNISQVGLLSRGVKESERCRNKLYSHNQGVQVLLLLSNTFLL